MAASMPPHGPAPGRGTTLPLFATADRQAMTLCRRMPADSAVDTRRCLRLSLCHGFASEGHASMHDQSTRQRCSFRCRKRPTPTVSACARAGMGPYAAWMPRKSLICSESGSLGVESRRGPP
ncbi:hypothetical protein C7T87_04600 [Xanthomonas hortorum pv. hederae]|nr:hypothetical protein C7T87_04600 [Xanthomonas hortorum pv. hederae]